MEKRATRPSRKPLTNPKAKQNAAYWWLQVTKHPYFFDIIHAVKEHKKFKRGTVQETTHAQNFAAGYDAGFEDCAEKLLYLTEEDIPASSQSTDQYALDPELVNAEQP